MMVFKDTLEEYQNEKNCEANLSYTEIHLNKTG